MVWCFGSDQNWFVSCPVSRFVQLCCSKVPTVCKIFTSSRKKKNRKSKHFEKTWKTMSHQVMNIINLVPIWFFVSPQVEVSFFHRWTTGFFGKNWARHRSFLDTTASPVYAATAMRLLPMTNLPSAAAWSKKNLAFLPWSLLKRLDTFFAF